MYPNILIKACIIFFMFRRTKFFIKYTLLNYLSIFSEELCAYGHLVALSFYNNNMSSVFKSLGMEVIFVFINYDFYSFLQF